MKKRILTAMLIAAMAVSLAACGDSSKEDTATETSETVETTEAEKLYHKTMTKLKANGVKILTVLDNNYPKEFLSSVSQPPFVIYYTGNIRLLRNAIDKQDYVYLNGPNKFDLNKNKLITLNYGIISLGNNALNLWTTQKNDICRLIPVLAHKLVCTTVIKNSDVFNIVVSFNLSNNLNKDIYVVPTVSPSTNNTLINEGAFLLDKKEDLL